MTSPDSSFGCGRVVLYIDSLKAGGAERAILTYARWLVEMGMRPTVLTRQSRGQDFYPIPAGVERAVEPIDPSWLRLFGWFGFPVRILRLVLYLRHQSPVLAIGMTTLPSIKLLLACCPLQIPCIVSERNYPPAKPLAFIWRMLRRITYPWAALHLVQTRPTGRWLIEHAGARDQILLPNPVQLPLPRFEPILMPDSWLASRGVSSDRLILLAVGTKLKQKGFDTLIKAFAQLAIQHINLHLVIVGLDSNPYHGMDQQYQLLRLLDASPNVSARAHFPGRVGNIAEWYAIADIFVLPSRFEGFPNVLLEAMSTGCACVASDCLTGPSDLIHHAYNGLLLPADASHLDWSECLDGLIKDEYLRNTLASNALEVCDRYGEPRIKKTFHDALSGLIHSVPLSYV